MAGLAVTAPAAAAPPAAQTAQFDCTLLIAEDAPAFQFSGSILFTSDRMKIDVTQHATQEHVVILVDFKADVLTTLFPDTLNGQRYPLGAFDHIQGFARISNVLHGKPAELPADWEETANKASQLDGVDCNYRCALSPQGLQVELWTGADGRPLRAAAIKDSLRVVVDMRDFKVVDSLEESAFAVPDGYTVKDAQEGVPAGLPQL